MDPGRYILVIRLRSKNCQRSSFSRKFQRKEVVSLPYCVNAEESLEVCYLSSAEYYSCFFGERSKGRAHMHVLHEK